MAIAETSVPVPDLKDSHPAKTALVVDDDDAFRQSVVRVLHKAGYEIVEAWDGASALRELETIAESVDLIVVDLCLPDTINGLDIILAAARRKIPAKIIAASAVMDDSYLEMAHDLGAHVAIRKPDAGEVAAWCLQALHRAGADPAPPVMPSQRTVVVVDDEEGVRRFVKSLLRRGGFQVLEAGDAASALALIEKIGGAMDLLVTDYMMPNVNGAELVRSVRERYPDVPVVYMSGYIAESEQEQLENPEASSAFVAKPFFPKAFLSVVTKMIDSAQSAKGQASA